MKGITLEENSDKALTDKSKFAFGLRPKANLLLSVNSMLRHESRCTTSQLHWAPTSHIDHNVYHVWCTESGCGRLTLARTVQTRLSPSPDPFAPHTKKKFMVSQAPLHSKRILVSEREDSKEIGNKEREMTTTRQTLIYRYFKSFLHDKMGHRLADIVQIPGQVRTWGKFQEHFRFSFTISRLHELWRLAGGHLLPETFICPTPPPPVTCSEPCSPEKD